MANPCPREGCRGELVVHAEAPQVSAAGLLGAFVALAGLGLLLVNGIVGLLVIIAGILVGWAGRGKRLVAVCPVCGLRQQVPKG